MSYREAVIRGNQVLVGGEIEKHDALKILRKGGSIYTRRSKAHQLAEALSQGGPAWRHAAHVMGGFKHYHDTTHKYAGHIFYGGSKSD